LLPFKQIRQNTEAKAAQTFDKMRVMNRKYDDDFKRNPVKKVLNG
jgi:hypothetical protein